MEVKKNNAVIAQFVYDGDGKRVKSIEDGKTILFVSNGFEINITTGEVSKYYFAGATRIAMRKYTIPEKMEVEYFLSDHLGSTSLTTDMDGNKISEMRYKPFGEIRYTWKSSDPEIIPSAYALTRQTFTGQYSYMDDPSTSGVSEGFGLMFYNARWYDPYTGRMAQADTIVPGGVQGLDRYAYGLNNPSRYIDPSGHMPIEGCGDEGKNACKPSEQEIIENNRRNADFHAETERNQCAGGNTLHCSYAQNHPYETAAFAGGGLLLAGAGAAAVSATTVTAETAVTTTTVVEATNGFCGGDMCAGEADELSRFFYSGGIEAHNEAETLAKTYNAVILDQTEAGAELTQIYEALGYPAMRPFAEAASAEWAARASGRVDVILKLPLFSGNIWATIEYPALLVNDAVKTIVIHIIP
ncbi:MAG: RHS repeat-associated core domain-containing protein [Anaerolineales bacterium]|nr:RHS repeat-associated core domain-containing protein [Anaerolineales bacterium]